MRWSKAGFFGNLASCLTKRPTPGQRRSKHLSADHGRFNRFRKLLVRYEKLEHTFIALNPLAAAVIALRKINPPIYG